MGGKHMDEKQYNFTDFIDKVKDMDYHDIMEYGEREIVGMESMSYSNPGGEKDRDEESFKYTEQVKAFLLFMGQGIKPVGVSGYDFRLYRIVVEYLVAKGQMKPEAIEIFISSK
jgi:hypothetical protein